MITPAPTQAEIDAAVRLATALKAKIAKLPKSDERREIIETTLMVPVESSEAICDALLALAADQGWQPTPAQIVAAMTASFLVQGFAYPDALNLYETANFILARNPPTPAGETGK